MLSQEQGMVKRFHREFGLLINDRPTIPPIKDVETSLDLIEEEFKELIADCRFERLDNGYMLYDGVLPISQEDYKPNIIGVADALGDLIYVILGMANRFGIEMEPVFQEIQNSNMTKTGGHLNEAGKYIKPETYTPADIK